MYAYILETIKHLVLSGLILFGIWYLALNDDQLTRNIATLLAIGAWVALINWVSKRYLDVDALLSMRPTKKKPVPSANKDLEGVYLYEDEKCDVRIESGKVVAYNSSSKRVPPMEILMYGMKQ